MSLFKKLLQKRFIIPITIVVCAGLGFWIYQGFIAPKYPNLPKNAVYYETQYPSGLIYSQGWYGTLEQAPMGGTVWLYDDDNGVCLVSFPTSAKAVPSGGQGGTTLTQIVWADANILVRSYPLSDYKAISSNVLAKMTQQDFYVGVWGGKKLTQKFSPPKANTETILSSNQLSQLSQKQQLNEKLYDPNRYFVLATGNNNWSSTGTWSANSNGSPTGASVPTAADAVLPSTSIGTGATLVVDATGSCLSMDWTGCANTPTFTMNANKSIIIYGNATFIANMNVNAGNLGCELYFYNSSGTATLTTNGLSLPFLVQMDGAGGTLQLGYTLTDTNTAQSVSVSHGIFLCNGHNIVATGQVNIVSASGSRTFDMTGVTVTCGDWEAGTNGTLTFVQDSSSKIIVANNISGTIFNGASLSYNEVDYTGSASLTIKGSNTFTNLVLLSSVAHIIYFTDSTTTTVTNCSLSGSAGHVHTLTGTSTGGWNLIKSGGGTVTVSYCTISYSVASPAATWYYDTTCTYNSTSGWTAIAPSITNFPTTLDFGIVMPNTTYYAYNQSSSGSYPNPVTATQCYFTITNNGSTCNIALSCSNATGGNGWTLVGSSPTGDQFKVVAVYNGENPASGLVLTNANQAFYTGLAASATLLWDFKELLGGTGTGKAGTFSDSTVKTYTITITGS